jgi:hypothetical protein
MKWQMSPAALRLVSVEKTDPEITVLAFNRGPSIGHGRVLAGNVWVNPDYQSLFHAFLVRIP